MKTRSTLAASLVFAGMAGADAQSPPQAPDIDKVRFAPAGDPARAGDAAREHGYNRYLVVCPLYGTRPLVALDTAAGGASRPVARFAETEMLGALSLFSGEVPTGSPLTKLFNAGTLGPGGEVRPAYSLKQYEMLRDRQDASEAERAGMSATDRTQWQALARHALDFCAGRTP